MTLAPEVQSLIDWGHAINKRFGALALPELRQVLTREFDAEMRRRGMVAERVASVSEVSIPVAEGQILARIFTPDGAGPHPLFVHFHGGGFALGTVHSLFNDAKCTHICRQAGCVVVTVEYRLAPEHRFPTAPNDCYTALLWAAENARELGLDPDRIAVGGESAGGNLAAVVALMARDRGGPPLALQLLEVPVTDLSSGAGAYPSVPLYGKGYGLDAADMERFADAYLRDPADGSNPYASPLLAENLAGVASAHVLTAELDVLCESGEAYARRLEAAGVETNLRRFVGHTHGSSALWQTWGPARAWMDGVVAAVRSALHRAETELPGAPVGRGVS